MFKQINISKRNIKSIFEMQEQFFLSNHQNLSKSQMSIKRQKQKQKRNKSISQATVMRTSNNEPEKQQMPNDCNQALKNKFFPVIQQEQLVVQDRSKQHFSNMIFLAKMRRLGEKIKTQGVSVYSPQCPQIPEELYEEEYKGLHKFSNIAIKRLQKKCKKVSFSEFLDAKRQNDWKNKAKYSLLEPERKLSPQKGKIIGVQELYLGFSPQREINQNNREDIFRQNKSMNVFEIKRTQEKLRLLKCKARERYSSIPHISPTLEMKLQISRVNLCHPQ